MTISVSDGKATAALKAFSIVVSATPNKAHLRLASLSTEDRRDVDYALLDQRLRMLMTKPAMVGMAVGVVENGRITFLRGYGETLAGSGEPVIAP